jgi:uncharacterized protein (UPF0276 family)
MKTLTIIPIHEQVQDMLDLINLLMGTNYSTLFEAEKNYPKIAKTLKKLDQHERSFLVRRIEELR